MTPSWFGHPAPGESGTVNLVSHHLAQLNVGRLNEPLDHPATAEFVDALDEINALAESSPGFVWRLTDDDGNSSSYVELDGNDNPLLVANYSIWTDHDSLKAFVYDTAHVDYLRRRAEWFARMDEAYTVCWWIPAGTIPDVNEANRRLRAMIESGPSDEGWPFNRPRPAPAPATDG